MADAPHGRGELRRTGRPSPTYLYTHCLESRSAVCWRGLGGVDGQRKVFNIPLPILSIGRWARGHTRVRPAAVGLALLQGVKVQEGRREKEQDGTHREAVQT